MKNLSKDVGQDGVFLAHFSYELYLPKFRVTLQYRLQNNQYLFRLVQSKVFPPEILQYHLL